MSETRQFDWITRSRLWLAGGMTGLAIGAGTRYGFVWEVAAEAIMAAFLWGYFLGKPKGFREDGLVVSAEKEPGE